MNEIRKWRKNALLTQKEFSDKFEIPLRTVESWEGEKRNPPAYVEKLIVEKLKNITEETLKERARKNMNQMPSDKEGRRPIGTWATIEKHKNSDDEFVEKFKTMDAAIENLKHCCEGEESYVAYIICNENDNGEPGPWYEDRKGNVYADHDYITV